ncbi:hypothetical protein C0J52_09091 [Blattella germanica]|nr:hypothetical protein C0J52_09091 [Blattella germanica]
MVTPRRSTTLLSIACDKNHPSQALASYKADRRLTGSQVIDESLQEILGYILRDYVCPWYDRVSADPEFPHEVRQTAQRVIVTFAGRMKEVDWIPFLTTRLVDDAASHLRLFRQARAKMKQHRSRHKKQPSTEIRPSTSIAVASETEGKRSKQAELSAESNASSTTTKPPPDLESLFFDLEVTMEDNLLCRDLICTEKDSEKQYLRDVSEVLLFLLLPGHDFHCKPLRFLLRELMVSTVVLPLFALCKEIPLTSDVFLTALRVTDNQEELNATRDMVSKEIAQLVRGDDDTAVKQQLSSLLYVRKVIDNRLQRLKEGADSDSVVKESCPTGSSTSCECSEELQEPGKSEIGAEGMTCVAAGFLVFVCLGLMCWGYGVGCTYYILLKLGWVARMLLNTTCVPGLPSHIDWNRLLTPGTKLFSLPLDVVLKNNIALSYFIDYMSSIGAQAYLFFYLNVEGWRVSAEQQISDMELQKLTGAGDGRQQVPNPTLENMKEAAYSIYEQYLSEKASPRLKLDETVVKRLVLRIRSEIPNETWFDEVQAAVYERLQTEERFLPGFRGSVAYVKLLAELDLLKDPSSRSDEEDDEISLSDNISLSSFDAEYGMLEGATVSTVSVEVPVPTVTSAVPDLPVAENNASRRQMQTGPFNLQAEIIETGVVNDRGKTYGIYAVSVAKRFETGFTEKWHVYRRYSDFHDLHQKVKDKYGDLGKLTFPGKKTFHNMERAVLEKRMKMLNDYLQILLQSGVIDTHPQLQRMLLAFLEQGDYDKGVSGGQISRTVS